MKSVLLVYDIPQTCKLANPSYKLRAVGFRANLSCWVIPEHRIPWEYLETWPTCVKREIVRFDLGEETKIRELAREALNRETGKIRESMEKSLKKAVFKLEEAEAAYFHLEIEEKVVKQKRNGVKYVIEAAKKELLKAEEAAIGFDLLAEVSEAYESTRRSIKAQQMAYFAEAEVMAVTTTVEEVTAAFVTAAEQEMLFEQTPYGVVPVVQVEDDVFAALEELSNV